MFCLNDYQQKLLHEAFLLACDHPKVARSKICAIIAKRKKVLAYGFNQSKSHTFQAKYARRYQAIHPHAEIDAIKNALKRLSKEDLVGADLYVARAKRNKANTEFIHANAKPCSGCQKAIVEFGIKNVFYTQDEVQL